MKQDEIQLDKPVGYVINPGPVETRSPIFMVANDPLKVPNCKMVMVNIRGERVWLRYPERYIFENLPPMPRPLDMVKNAISNIRHGEPGKILFDFKGSKQIHICSIKEPTSVLLVGYEKSAKEYLGSWYGQLLICLL